MKHILSNKTLMGKRQNVVCRSETFIIFILNWVVPLPPPPSDNHNVSNVKIHTYIMAPRLRSIRLNMSWYDSAVRSGYEWFTNSDVHCGKFPESKEHQSQNEHTSIGKHPSQPDAFYQMKSPSEKRENSFINIETWNLFHNSVPFS